MTPDEVREPAMERAMPADAVPGSTIPEDTDAEMLLRDGEWVWCQVIGQRKDRHGRWCVGVRWYASSAIGGREGWYLFDPALIRRLNPALPWRPLVLAQLAALVAREVNVRRVEPVVTVIDTDFSDQDEDLDVVRPAGFGLPPQ